MITAAQSGQYGRTSGMSKQRSTSITSSARTGWGALFKLLVPFLVLVGCLLSTTDALASHFRHGQISWYVPDPVNAPRTVRFTVTTTWRANSIGSTVLQFGDNTNNGSQQGTSIGTGSDATGGAYAVMEYTANHTYATNGPWTAFFTDCCRIAGLQNGSEADFRVQSIVNLNGSNSAPGLIASSFLIAAQAGGVRTFDFLMGDADGETPTCRLGTDAEAGFTGATPTAAGNKQPSVSSVGNVCKLTWDLTGATAGQKFVLHLVSETVRNGALSSAAIDLMMEIVNSPVPTCTGSGSFTLTSGTPFENTLTGTIAAGGNLAILGAGVPAGATLTPASGTTGASPYATSFKWTPGTSDRGTSRSVVVNFRNTATNVTGTCTMVLNVAPCSTVCGGQTPYCAVTGPQAGQCVACISNDQCTASASAPVCNQTTNTCVACDTDFNSSGNACPFANAPACNTSGPLAGQCTACSTSNTTQCLGGTPACSSAGQCVQCSTANTSQCTGGTATCDNASNTCVQCTTVDRSACTGNTPACDVGTHTCASCSVDTSVCGGGTPVCNTSSGSCVQCTSSTAHCAGTTPFCNGANTCVACNGDFGTAASAGCPETANPFCQGDGACTKCTDNGTGTTGCRNNDPAHSPYCEPVSGSCGTGCLLDAECSNVQFCATDNGVCTPKAPNGQPLPSPGPIGGVCNPTNATRGCLSETCDTTNQLCGLTNSKACTGDVCQSGVCFTDSLCGKPNGETCNDTAVCRSAVCFTDGSCGLPVNDRCTSSAQCRGSACVSADGPRCGNLNGVPCTAASECRSGVCNADTRCGDPNGTTCTTADTCRSGICTAGKCGGVCSADSECATSYFCDGTTKRCVRDLAVGESCARPAQCQSEVCANDGKCGALDGAACTNGTSCRNGGCQSSICGGSCSDDTECAASHFCDAGACVLDLANSNPCTRASQCLSGVCNADGQCGQPTGQPCGSAVQCRSDLCDAEGTCATTCTNDTQCGAGKFCDSGACVAVRPNDQACARAAQCSSGDCNTDGKCGEPDGNPCGVGEVCRSGLCTADGVCSSCKVDSDCGGPLSGRVCHDTTKKCVDGCRQGGNGCVVGSKCSATAPQSIGSCQPVQPDSGPDAGSDGGVIVAGPSIDGGVAAAIDNASVAGAGCTCNVRGSNDGGALLAFGGVGALAFGLVIRRRRRG